MADARPRSLSPFGLYMAGLRAHGGRFLGGVLALISVDLLDLCPPLIIRAAVDYLGTAGPVGPLADLAILYVCIVMAQGVGRYGFRNLFFGTSHLACRDLRQRYYEKLLALDTAYFVRTPTGELISRATNDVEAVRRFYGFGTLLAVDCTMYFLTVPPIMIYISPTLTLYSLLPLLAVGFVVHALGRAIHRHFRAIQEVFGQLSSRAQENFAGIRVVQANNQQAPQIAAFRKVSDDYVEKNLALARVSAWFEGILHSASGLGILIVLLIGGRQAVDGQISVGDFTAFIYLLMRMVWPMLSLGWVISLYQRGMASLGRIAEVLDTEPTILSPKETRPAPQGPADLSIENVTVSYSGRDHAALNNLSLRIAAGSTVVIVGPIGSGKSTLLRLLPRMVDPSEGVVRLGDVDLRDLDLQDLRGRIGYVPQDPFLFSETIRTNLELGHGGIDLDQLRLAAEAARVRGEIESFAGGFETALGERGINLSGGQKQRLTLARALARQPEILVLDDCLSSVDARTEEEIVARLRPLLVGRTVLMATHRLSAVHLADQVVFVQNGRIEEQGRADELLARNGPYARFVAERTPEDEAPT